VFLTSALYEKLTAWVDRNYRDSLRPDDLADPKLLDESRRAMEELSRILQLPLNLR
jgi:succinylarginine dihydrolase